MPDYWLEVPILTSFLLILNSCKSLRFYFILFKNMNIKKKEKNSAVVKGNFGLGFNDRRQLCKVL